MDEFAIYLNQVRAINVRFSREEEMKLALAKEQGDQEARERLIHSCLPMVVHLAKKWLSIPNRMDLIQEGNEGLMVAVDKFKPWLRNTRLTTYAHWWIRQRIHRFLTNERGGVIHIPLDVVQGAREPKEALARVTTAKLLYGGGPISTERLRFPEQPKAGTLGDTLQDQREPSREEQDEQGAYNHDLSRLLNLISQLQSREGRIILERMAGGKENTLGAIGLRLGISRERVRQIEGRARDRLRVLNEHTPQTSNGRKKHMEDHDLSATRDDTVEDPFAILDRISLAQIEAEIIKTDQTLARFKASYKKRIAYLKKLRDLVAVREGAVPPTRGPRRTPVAGQIQEYLKKKPQQTQGQIVEATGLATRQVSTCLRMGTTKFKKNVADRWSLLND